MPSDLNQRRLRLIWQPTIYGVQGPWLRRRCRIRKVFMCDCISYHDEYHHVLPPRHTPSMAVSENENVVESRRTEIFGHGYCVVIHRMRLPGPRPLFSPSFWHMVRLPIILKQGCRVLCRNWSLIAPLQIPITDKYRHRIWPSKSASII